MIRCRGSRCGGQACCRAAEEGARPAGFSLVELLIAMTICALISGAVAATVPPSRAAFEHTPAALDVHQRARTAADALEKAIRSAMVVVLHDVQPNGDAARLQAVSRSANGSQGVVALDQMDGGSALVLSTSQCPLIPDICGFRAGATAMISSPGAPSEVFVVMAADMASRSLIVETPLAQPYSSGAFVNEVDAYTFRIVMPANGPGTLVRETAAGAVQPVVDGVSDLAFLWRSPRELEVRLQLDPLQGAPASVRSTVARLVIFTRNAP